MAIRKIVFDMEGTILGHELEEIHFEAFRLAAAAVGVFFDPDNIVADMASKIRMQLVAAIAPTARESGVCQAARHP